MILLSSKEGRSLADNTKARRQGNQSDCTPGETGAWSRAKRFDRSSSQNAL